MDRRSRQSDSPLILTTGFGPFPGAPRNPTATLIADLPGEASPGFRLAAHVLPVCFAEAPRRLADLIADMQPDGIVMFGLSAEATGFTLERVARNRIGPGRADARGALSRATAIAAAGPATRSSTLPLAAIAHRLDRAGLPVAWSTDAGDYLCNMVFYSALARLAARPVPAGFIHVPHTPETAPPGHAGAHMPRADLLAGARIILHCAAADAALPVSGPSAGP